MDEPRDPGAGFFPTTCWSQLRVGGSDEQRAMAWDTLARQYERPIHAWLRAAFPRHRADVPDLAQDFFTWMLHTDLLSRADPELGRFRAFLKVALKHYVVDWQRRNQTLKRGGAEQIVSLTAADGDEREVAAPPSHSPEEQLDRAWRAELLGRALEAADDELKSSGHPLSFALFREYFVEGHKSDDYATLAERHGVSTVDVSNALMRAKRVYRSQLRRLVMESVHSPEDLEEELRWLFGQEAR